jgi:hypothetical protein
VLSNENSPSTVWKGGKEELKKCTRGDKFVQNTLYTPIELSQGNSPVLLMYANKKKQKKKIPLRILLRGLGMWPKQ